MFFYTFIPKLLNMSLTASVVILFVALARLILRRAPKIFSYALWSVVLFRLLCPVSIDSGVSVFGLLGAPATAGSAITSSIEYIPPDIVHTEYPAVTLPIPGAGEAISEALPQGEEQLAADPLEAPTALATYVWMAGVLVMAGYAVVSYVRLRRRLVPASPLDGNVYLCDGITSPFVLGLFRPKIYIPSSVSDGEIPCIILHERHHIRRFDHIIKALAFAALCIHWFNPLVWLAFILAGRDMEMSCDEAVLRRMGADMRAGYAASLLNLATGRRIISGTPLAFGEGDPGSRIRNIARWKKPALWVALAAVAVCAVLAAALITNPAQRQTTLMGAHYYISETLYSADFTGEEALSEPLEYCVTADYHLYVRYADSEPWEYLGALEKYPLTKDELLGYLPHERIDGYRLSEITDAYILRTEGDNFYLAAQTASGDTLLSYGWEDIGERGQGVSDDASLRRLYLLESSFREMSFNVGFFERSLRATTGADVYAFCYHTNNDIPGYAIIGFMCGGSGSPDGMTDMGFAVFESTGTGYRLLDCKVYEDAALAPNGVYFCDEPAVADVNGEMRRDCTFDVVLVCSEEVGKIERIYFYDDGTETTVSDTNDGVCSMFLFSWKYDNACMSMSQFVYDKDGNLLSEDFFDKRE